MMAKPYRILTAEIGPKPGAPNRRARRDCRKQIGPSARSRQAGFWSSCDNNRCASAGDAQFADLQDPTFPEEATTKKRMARHCTQEQFLGRSSTGGAFDSFLSPCDWLVGKRVLLEISTVRFKETDGSKSSNSAVMTAHRRSLLALLIDVPYYEAQSALNFGNVDQIVEHFMQIGWTSGFDPSPTFQSARYVNATRGLLEVGTNPFVHYLFDVVGEDALINAIAGLSASNITELRVHFNAGWYLRKYADVARSGSDPLIHYLTLGWHELRDPSPSFSTAAYLNFYMDVRTAGINPFLHWVLYGIKEGRSCGGASSPIFDSWESLSVRQQTILEQMFSIDYYRSHHAVGDRDGGLLLAKQVSSGEFNVENATPSFFAAKYSAAHPELRHTAHVPFLHYLFDVVGEDALHDLFVMQPRTVVETICEHFDAAWYLYSYPDVEVIGQDALIHYMTTGWRERRDPSQVFSTVVYLLRYPDIVEADQNPFLHWIEFGKAEGRSGASSASKFRDRLYTPSITVILFNREANPLTPACIAAVTSQSYKDLSILVVGAPLSSGCRAALDAGARSRGGVAISYLPDDDLTSPWKLLESAVKQAPGDLLWFVQGRGVHDAAFLIRLASSFADGSVQLGFGRRLEPDDADYMIGEDELARRMEGWNRHSTTPAALWFPERLQSDMLGDEQHSFLWRRRKLGERVWRRADDYRYLGLWHIYLNMASGGQIATVRDALLRIPPASVSSRASLGDDRFRQDVIRLTAEVQSFWPAPGIARTNRHILIVTHGIFAGGAENLPIQMANALAARGIIVSLLIFKADVNAQMRATLDPGVSIYEADWVMEYGCEQFLRDIGCSLIHSHGVIGEMFFIRLCEGALPVPYVVTLHGSYEASSSAELPERFIAKIVRSVDLFVYTADKNLAPLVRNDVRQEQLIKMINAMPVDAAPFPWSRAELGIAEDAIVFTLVARGIPEKGWATAVNAFRAVQRRNPSRLMHLCLVGEGDEPERLKPLCGGDGSISLLGFQLRIHGLYRMTDVAIVPTRFAGESFPLCIIQALQVSVPVIATDLGEIASMLEVDGVEGGIVVEDSPIDKHFDARFTDAMHSLVDDERRRRLASGAAVLGKRYDMDAFTDQYVALYEEVIARFAAPRAAIPAHGSSGSL